MGPVDRSEIKIRLKAFFFIFYSSVKNLHLKVPKTCEKCHFVSGSI